jgi:hypothetical protein
VIGKFRTRFAVAWKMALATAAAVPTTPISVKALHTERIDLVIRFIDEITLMS